MLPGRLQPVLPPRQQTEDHQEDDANHPGDCQEDDQGFSHMSARRAVTGVSIGLEHVGDDQLYCARFESGVRTLRNRFLANGWRTVEVLSSRRSRACRVHSTSIPPTRMLKARAANAKRANVLTGGRREGG